MNSIFSCTTRKILNRIPTILDYVKFWAIRIEPQSTTITAWRDLFGLFKSSFVCTQHLCTSSSPLLFLWCIKASLTHITNGLLISSPVGSWFHGIKSQSLINILPPFDPFFIYPCAPLNLNNTITMFKHIVIFLCICMIVWKCENNNLFSTALQCHIWCKKLILELPAQVIWYHLQVSLLSFQWCNWLVQFHI